MQTNWMVGITALWVMSATSAPLGVQQTPGPGRSCDGAAAAPADTSVDSQDLLLRTVHHTGGRGAPRYPASMRNAGITGEVLASFVVDTLGMVPSGGAWIERETQPSFGDAVCAYLREARFTPLVVNGKRISVRVTNAPTSFGISR